MSQPNTESTRLPTIAKTASWVTRRIHAALSERRDIEAIERAKRVSLSQIGKCARAQWASLHGVPEENPPEGRILVLFDLGSAVEDHIVKLLWQAGFELSSIDDETGKQYEVSGFGGKVLGHLDGLIRFKKSQGEADWALLEIKSANAKKYAELELAGSYAQWNPVYGDQVQVYMGAKDLQQALVIVENKDTSDLYVEVIDFDQTRFTELWHKAADIASSTKILDRPAEAKSQYCGYCKWCGVNKWCWGATAGVTFDD